MRICGTIFVSGTLLFYGRMKPSEMFGEKKVYLHKFKNRTKMGKDILIDFESTKHKDEENLKG